jgi:small subunit ribosomal protein S9
VSETSTTPESPATPGQQVFLGVGRRKAAVARVRLRPGSGQMVFNKKRSLEEYFSREQDRIMALASLRVTGSRQKYDVVVNVRGGGSAGQAGAVRLGIARALSKADGSHYHALKDAGMLTRDARRVERKKPGQAGARRSFQFSKR